MVAKQFQTKNLGHLMLDLETMGNDSYSVITSIGAVEFDLNTGEYGRTFYERIDIQSCLNSGMKINGSTIYWWLQQNDEARKEMCKPSDNIKNVLEKFKSFMDEIGGNSVYIYGRSPRFDCGLLKDAYVLWNYQSIPWDFRKELDVRTFEFFSPEIKANESNVGTEHYPLDDCRYQINYCTNIWKKFHPELK